MNPLDRFLAALGQRGYEPKRSGKGWVCKCPAHDDHNPSLSIGTGEDGRVLVKCWTGCPADAIVGAVGLKLADLFADSGDSHAPRPRRRRNKDTPKPTADGGDSVAVARVAKPQRVFPTAADAAAEWERKLGPRSRVSEYQNAAGEVVGLVLRWDKGIRPKVVRPVSRLADGSGWTCEGMPTLRPLYGLPTLLATPTDTPVWVCEGEKAADAARAVGLVATTSPHGCESAAKADWGPMRGRPVVVSPDHDEPGEKYAADVVRLALEAGARSVRVVRLAELWAGMPERGDMADFVEHRGGDADAVKGEVEAAAGRAQATTATVPTIEPPKGDDPATAELVVRMALEFCRLGQTTKREPFAVLNIGPNVAGLLGGSGDWLHNILSREFRRRHGRVMNSSAYADAVATLKGEAMDLQPEETFVRVAQHGEAVVLDLGDVEGRAVVVDRDGWRVVDRSPVLFLRTALTSILPTPVRGGSLDQLRELLNVTDDSWPILLGWMVAALIPDMPHPILMLGGQQGTGKTMAARYICGVFDPSPAPTRSQPRNEESWAVMVAHSWTTVIDNVSTIPAWLSDALCKVVTGDGWVRRGLYTNADPFVLSFRRVVALTTIDAGALRGDLGERMVLVDLEPIAPEKRRTERELNKAYDANQPAILGALLDLLAGALSRLDSVNLPTYPRMADFARLLAAVDATIGTDSLSIYAEQGTRIAGEVLEADPVGDAVAAFVRRIGVFQGTAAELLKAIKPQGAQHEGWPDSGRGMGAALKRLTPALALQGVAVTPPKPTDRTRIYLLQATARIAQSPEV